MSAKALSREIAIRVTAALIHDLETDPLELAFAAIDRGNLHCPIHRLAACPEIDTASLFVERRVARLRARSGRYLLPAEQSAELRVLLDELKEALAGRYDRLLRGTKEEPTTTK
jgi:hypothetical protein